MPEVIFLISVPRSGSTLLQKLLMAHSEISSVAEPWVMLPWAYAFRRDGVQAEYGHHQSVKALGNLFRQLPNGRQDYCEIVRRNALDLYGRIAGDSRYFLDKTPRYFFIIPELSEIFPDAKFLLLLRNPVGIFASTIEAFRANKLRRLDGSYRDLLGGTRLLAAGARHLGERAHVVRYERLVGAEQDGELQAIFDYLQLPFERQVVHDFANQQLDGQGDHLGAKQFERVVDQTDRWQAIIDSPVRRLRLLRYLGRVDQDYLQIGGYDRDACRRAVRRRRATRLRPMEWFYWLEEACIDRLKRTIPISPPNYR